MATIAALLHYYRFDCGNLTIDRLIAQWECYEPIWVRQAIVEAIYRGRYKAISVSEILRFWQRRGEPYHRFNHEFERSICGDFVFTLPNQHPIVKKTPLSLPAVNWDYLKTTPFEQRLRALCTDR